VGDQEYAGGEDQEKRQRGPDSGTNWFLEAIGGEKQYPSSRFAMKRRGDTYKRKRCDSRAHRARPEGSQNLWRWASINAQNEQQSVVNRSILCGVLFGQS